MIDTPSPVYLAAWASQIGFLSAFLGGFAATFVAMILNADKPGQAAGWAMGLAAVAAISFVVAAVATTTVAAGAHPDAPAVPSGDGALMRARIVAALCFSLGAYLLLAAVACSGWLRSRKIGWTTTIAGVVGGVLVTLSFLSL